jgi:hypothetical protein
LTLAQADLTAEDMAYLCDRNPRFHGLFWARTYIPTVDPVRLLTDPVDEVIVFSFGYMAEIRRQLDGYLQQGGRLVSLLEIL